MSTEAVADIELAVELPAEAPVPPPDAAEAPGPQLQRAQAIDCGGVRIAVPFTWARNIVDSFVLSEAPLAPPWLAGAANIDGQIVPVVDLAAWFDAGRAQSVDRHSRLLLGGRGDDAFALLFSGLPALVRWAAGHFGEPAYPQLQAYVIGQVIAIGGDMPAVPVIDMAGLGEAWVSELSV